MRNRDTAIAALAATAIAAYWVTGSSWPLLAVLVLGGVPLLLDLARGIARGEFGADLLAGVSIVTAAVLGEYLVAVIVVLMLSGGQALEAHATRRASSVLDALARRMPQTAHREEDGRVSDVALGAIVPGDRLVVFPHEVCPVDGVVAEGHGAMDEAYLTGEPFRISKAPGAAVISGAINGETALTITATRLASDSRYARIMGVIERAGLNRPPMRRLADRLAVFYTPTAVAVAAASWLISGDPVRFLAVVVVATPCPLLIAIPVAVIGAISLAARRGIIIRNAAALETISQCRTLIFDKTGTLTYGAPSLTSVVPAPGFTEEAVLAAAASLEQYSKHPLASAVLKAARAAGQEPAAASRVTEKPGEGLRGVVRGQTVVIAGRGAIPEGGWTPPPGSSGLECVVLLDGAPAALFRFHDAPRPDSGRFIGHLPKRHGVRRVVLLSGDREVEVRRLAGEVGITEVFAGKSPEEKLAIVGEAARREPVLFVGDGINDAPALVEATVGVVLGQQSDITTEAADAVVLDASLARVDELIHISARMRRIALQSAVGGMALSAAGMVLAAVGWLPPVAGAVAQEVIDLAAVLNAVRVAIPEAAMSDYEAS